MEKRVTAFLLVLVLALGGCVEQPANRVADEAPGIRYQCPDGTWVNNLDYCEASEGMYYEMETSLCPTCGIAVSKIWIQGTKARAEAYEENRLFEVTLGDGEKIYSWSEAAGWHESELQGNQDYKKTFEFYFIDRFKDEVLTLNCTPEKRETVNGIETQKYNCEVDGYVGNAPQKMKFSIWRWEEKEIIVKWEAETYHYEKKNFRFFNIPDSVFTKNLQVE